MLLARFVNFFDKMLLGFASDFIIEKWFNPFAIYKLVIISYSFSQMIYSFESSAHSFGSSSPMTTNILVLIDRL